MKLFSNKVMISLVFIWALSSCNHNQNKEENNMEHSLRSEVVGAWKLKNYVEIDEETGEANYPFGKQPSGFIIYTSDGYMSAQIQKNGRQLFKNNDMFGGSYEEYKDEGSGYLAYSGRFFVDEKEKKITHEMAVSLFPNWLGNKQKRLIKIEKNILNLETDGPLIFNGKMKVAKITWEKAEPNL